jgi:hypothetical protein
MKSFPGQKALSHILAVKCSALPKLAPYMLCEKRRILVLIRRTSWVISQLDIQACFFLATRGTPAVIIPGLWLSMTKSPRLPGVYAKPEEL